MTIKVRYIAIQSDPDGWGVWDSLLNQYVPWSIFGNYPAGDEIRGITQAGAQSMADGLSKQDLARRGTASAS
jgi:hypothetical protein